MSHFHMSWLLKFDTPNVMQIATSTMILDKKYLKNMSKTRKTKNLRTQFFVSFFVVKFSNGQQKIFNFKWAVIRTRVGLKAFWLTGLKAY